MKLLIRQKLLPDYCTLPTRKHGLRLAFVSVFAFLNIADVPLPIDSDQIVRWSRPRPEPVSLDLPGWTISVREPDAAFPNERLIRFTRGASAVEIFRYWDYPRTPGGPIEIRASRSVTVGARETDLHTTSWFEGVQKEVHVLWLRGKGYDVDYGVRLVFERCPKDVVNKVLSRIQLNW